jgi:hypothetical protein
MHRHRPVERRARIALDGDCGNLDGVATIVELLREVANVTLLASGNRRVELREQEYAHREETLPVPFELVGESDRRLGYTLAGQWQCTGITERFP